MLALFFFFFLVFQFISVFLFSFLFFIKSSVAVNLFDVSILQYLHMYVVFSPYIICINCFHALLRVCQNNTRYVYFSTMVSCRKQLETATADDRPAITRTLIGFY